MEAVLRRSARLVQKRNALKQKRIENLDWQTKSSQALMRHDRRHDLQKLAKYGPNAEKKAFWLGEATPYRGLNKVMPKTVDQKFTSFPPNLSGGLERWEIGDARVITGYFRKGDRVVLVSGPDKGRIDTIEDIFSDRQVVHLRNLSRLYVVYSDEVQEAYQTKMKDMQDVQIPVEMKDIRLVHRMGDRDVIVGKMLVRKTEDGEGGVAYQRFIPGTFEDLDAANPIDYAKRKRDQEARQPKPNMYPCDTWLTDTHKVSWAPSLDHLPMPESVVNEIINPHSKIEPRLDDAVIEKMVAKEAIKELKQQAVKVMLSSPAKEVYSRKLQAARMAREEAGPSEAVLSVLGQAMAKNLEVTGRQPVSIDSRRPSRKRRESDKDTVPVKVKSPTKPSSSKPSLRPKAPLPKYKYPTLPKKSIQARRLAQNSV